MPTGKFLIYESGWHGGIADDKLSGTPRSFQDGGACEVRENPSSLKLAQASEKISASVVTDLIKAFVTVQSTGDVLMFGDAGKIYRRAAGAGDPVNCYTDSGSDGILSAFEYNDYVYWCTATHVHRIAVADIDAAWAGDVTEDYKAFANGNTNAHPMTEMYNKLYIGDGSSLAELDSLGVWDNAKITIFGDEELIALNFTGSMLRMYSRRSTLVDYSRAYLWDGIQDSYNELILWQGLRIHAVTNLDGMDYVLAGKKPVLFASNGYQRDPIKRFPGVTGSLAIHPNGMTINDNLITIGAAASGDAINRGVWRWGRLNKDYNPSFTFDYPTSNSTTSEEIGAVHDSNGVLYQSWKNGSAYGVDAISSSKYAATGEIITRVHRGDAGFIDKMANAFNLSFAQIASGEKIEVYVRKNLEADWGSVVATVDYADTSDRGIVKKEITGIFDDQEFDFLEIKIKLTAGTSQLTTPELIELAIPYDLIKV